ncbi:MAG TPA: 8-amino-7-oxononanoate synthase [Sporichthyaceae bacterium]|jgi:8-amino-7-oxononanoate synthase|nr:8-amino-7-oxononanoate synthase [Sporichthyaceae bacterium]
MSGPFDWVDARAAQREADGLRRRLRPRQSEDGVLDLAGNDYLGLAGHPDVLAAATRALKEWGAGSTGSRLVTGSTALHAELEAAAADLFGAEAALCFSSGYLANIGAVTALTGPGTLIVSDAINHASLIDACRLSGARVEVTAHCDPVAVEAVLAARAEERAVVVTDGVFSVDGDVAPLAALAAAARRHGAGLIVDEAHAIGVIGPEGRGTVHEAGLSGAPDVVVTGVLSKSLGTQGGLVAGPRRVVEHLVDSARSFIFDTGLAPAAAGAGLAALELLRADPRLAGAVRARARDLQRLARQAGFDAPQPGGAVVGIRIGQPEVALACAAACLEAGVRVGCFRPPSVPDGWSRLRLTAHATLRPEDLDRAAAALAAAAAVAQATDR